MTITVKHCSTLCYEGNLESSGLHLRFSLLNILHTLSSYLLLVSQLLDAWAGRTAVHGAWSLRYLELVVVEVGAWCLPLVTDLMTMWQHSSALDDVAPDPWILSQKLATLQPHENRIETKDGASGFKLGSTDNAYFYCVLYRHSR